MEMEDLQRFRRNRLATAAEKAGGKAPLGRLLGYRDGSFVGQMLRGERPVSEETVLAIEALPGFDDWFQMAGGPPMRAQRITGADAVTNQVLFLLRHLDEADRVALMLELHERAARAIGHRKLAEEIEANATQEVQIRPERRAKDATERRRDTEPGWPDESNRRGEQRRKA